jgi:hypothetical protein
MRGLDLKTFESFYQGHDLWQLALRDNLRNCAKRLFGYSLYDRVRATMLRNSGTP